MSDTKERRSLYELVFGGRSLLSVFIGTQILADKNIAASIIAIFLVATLCYVVVFAQKYEYANALANIVFVIIGYYFGSKRDIAGQGEEDS